MDFKLIILLCLAAISVKSEVDSNFQLSLDKFSVNLFQIAVADEQANVVMSPVSIHTAVALTYMGATGKTEEEMKNVLSSPNFDKNQLAANFKTLTDNLKKCEGLNIANKLYLKKGYSIKPTFSEIATKTFDAGVESVNFVNNVKAAKTINDWVESKTNNKITNLIDPSVLDLDTRLVIVNAIHFKGSWAHQFDVDKTAKSQFYLNDKDTVDTNFMVLNKIVKYGVIQSLDATVVKLPYKNIDAAMYIIIPNSKTGLSQLEVNLHNIDFTSELSSLRPVTVQFKMPKFTFEYDIDLNEPLQKMGLQRMFTRAEFSDILESSESLEVTKVLHKAFIDVNEYGTEAAAATAVIMSYYSIGRVARPIQIKADHPFMFVIRASNSNLFMGRVVNPTK